MQCPNCHTEITADTTFCPNCGTAIAAQPPVLQRPPTLMLRNDVPKREKDNKPDEAGATAPDVKVEATPAPTSADQALAAQPVAGELAVEQPATTTLLVSNDPWICKQCNTLNPASEDYCELCGAMRVSVKPNTAAQPLPVASSTAAVDELMNALESMNQSLNQPWTSAEGTRPGWWFNSASGTNVGMGRRGNPDEDSVFTLEVRRFFEAQPESFALYIVADGMGGQAAGEVASRSAIQTMSVTITTELVAPWLSGQSFNREQLGEFLQTAVQQAHHRLRYDNLSKNIDSGTTLTACIVIDNLAVFANAGDSRTYLFRPKSADEKAEPITQPIVPINDRGTEKLAKTVKLTPKPKPETVPPPDLPYRIERVTRDQSLVQDLIDQGQITLEEAYSDPRRNVVLNALGAPEETIPIDIYYRDLKSGDRILLCSDGLWEMMRDPTMVELMVANQNNLPNAVNNLIDLANRNGGPDNISVIIVEVLNK